MRKERRFRSDANKLHRRFGVWLFAVLVWSILSLPMLVMAAPTKEGAEEAQVVEVPHYLIGAGSKRATFYPVAQAICTLVNQEQLGFTCEAVESGGSTDNLQAIASGTRAMGIAQHTLQYQAYKGEGFFADQGASPAIRTVMPLHTETFVIAVQPYAKITHMDDLLGKRVNIGNEGSGTRVILESVFDHLDWEDEDFVALLEARSAQLPDLLCNNKADAALYSAGHPNRIYAQMTKECGVRLVSFWNSPIADFVQARPEFSFSSLPPRLYEGQSQPISGFGILTVLSAHASVPAEHIGAMLAMLERRRETLWMLHPIFKTISLPPTHDRVQVAPYHEGAVAFEALDTVSE